MIISKISTLKTYQKVTFLPNLTILPSHLVCLRAVPTFCGMMLGQRQTLYALVFLTDHSGAMKLLLPSSFTVLFPHSFLPFPFSEVGSHPCSPNQIQALHLFGLASRGLELQVCTAMSGPFHA